MLAGSVSKRKQWQMAPGAAPRFYGFATASMVFFEMTPIEKKRTKVRETHRAYIMAIDDLTRSIDASALEHKCARPKVLAVQQGVAEHYGLPLGAMSSQIRTRDYAQPRQVAMYLARHMTKYSLSDIGNCFGGRDHGTVAHSMNAVNARLETEPLFKEEVDLVRALCKRKLENIEMPLFDNPPGQKPTL